MKKKTKRKKSIFNVLKLVVFFVVGLIFVYGFMNMIAPDEVLNNPCGDLTCDMFSSPLFPYIIISTIFYFFLISLITLPTKAFVEAEK